MPRCNGADTAGAGRESVLTSAWSLNARSLTKRQREQGRWRQTRQHPAFLGAARLLVQLSMEMRVGTSATGP